jgi:hypothetical protein
MYPAANSARVRESVIPNRAVCHISFEPPASLYRPRLA